MRILVVSNRFTPDIRGGYELGCGQMAAELSRRGHDVRVLTSSPAPGPPALTELMVQRTLRVEDVWDDELARLTDPRVRAATVGRACMVDFHNLSLLQRELQAFEADVVYLWNLVGVGGIALAIDVQLLGVPWVWHLMDAVPLELTAPARFRRHDAARLFTHLLTGEWIVCSRQLSAEISAGGGGLAERVEVVPNWVTGARPASRSDWYHGGRQLRGVFVGNLSQAKGVDILVDAAEELVSSGANVVFDVYGTGARLAWLRDRVGALGLAAHVRFKGQTPHDQLLHNLETADLLLFPTSEREPFAFAPLEAAARGCVPIVTVSCANAEAFDRNTILTAPREPRAFAAAVRQVLDGGVDLEAVGRAGQDAVWNQLHIERAGSRVESVLERARRAQRPGTAMDAAEALDLGRLAERVMDRVLAL